MEFSLNYVIRKDRINEFGKSPIYLRYTFKRKWINIPLKYTLEPKFWIDEQPDNRISRKYSNYNNLRTLMFDLESDVREIINSYFIKNRVYPDNSRGYC